MLDFSVVILKNLLWFKQSILVLTMKRGYRRFFFVGSSTNRVAR